LGKYGVGKFASLKLGLRIGPIRGPLHRKWI